MRLNDLVVDEAEIHIFPRVPSFSTRSAASDSKPTNSAKWTRRFGGASRHLGTDATQLAHSEDNEQHGGFGRHIWIDGHEA
jgi:hypothetical protein